MGASSSATANNTSLLMSLAGSTWSIIVRKMSGETSVRPVLIRIITRVPAS
jgi:hypothetical protein